MRLLLSDAWVSIARDRRCAYAAVWQVKAKASEKHVAALPFEIDSSNSQSWSSSDHA
jgi:hypothetical protein